MRALLDINVLIALLDADHVFQERAHTWWSANAGRGWARRDRRAGREAESPKTKAKDALLVPLLNPTEAIKGGARAKLGDPVTFKLGGLGVRDMAAWSGGFLIIAGDFDDRFAEGAKPSRIFFWKPGTDPQDIGIDFGDLNPEAIVIMRQGDKARILILSDDGKYPSRWDKNVFRGVWLQANTPIGGGNEN